MDLPERPPSSPDQGTLFVVATPIGNLEDITLRALRILKEVALVAAEDTRHTRKLLSRHGIPARLESYHDHNKERKAPLLLERLKAGDSIALVSDAGTPGISDPGYYLVRRAFEAGVPVVHIPGPAAIIAALSACGLPTDRFAFEGFLPLKPRKRKRRLEALQPEERTLIFYESPRRLRRLLAEIAESLGEREVVIARELTKVHEEFIRGRAKELAERLGEVRGECTVIVAPFPRGASPP